MKYQDWIGARHYCCHFSGGKLNVKRSNKRKYTAIATTAATNRYRALTNEQPKKEENIFNISTRSDVSVAYMAPMCSAKTQK